MTDDHPGHNADAEDLAWETLDSRISYTCEGFDIVTDDVRFPTGEEAEFDYLSESEAVVILPFTEDGDVVVIDQWRQPVGRVNRGLPAGNMEPEDADFEDAARRELAEETGYEADSMAHLTSVEPANGFSDALFHYVVAYNCTPTAERNLDYNESIRVDTATFEELLKAAENDDLRDGRSMLAILYYELFGEN